MYFIQVVKPEFPNQFWCVSRTSNARDFGGNIRLTKDKSQAKQFTRLEDARRHAAMIERRCKRYDFDREKFGLLMTEIKEVL